MVFDLTALNPRLGVGSLASILTERAAGRKISKNGPARSRKNERELTQHGFALILQFKAECLELLLRLLLERLDAVAVSLSEGLQVGVVVMAEALLQLLVDGQCERQKDRKKGRRLGRGRGSFAGGEFQDVGGEDGSGRGKRMGREVLQCFKSSAGARRRNFSIIERRPQLHSGATASERRKAWPSIHLKLFRQHGRASLISFDVSQKLLFKRWLAKLSRLSHTSSGFWLHGGLDRGRIQAEVQKETQRHVFWDNSFLLLLFRTSRYRDVLLGRLPLATSWVESTLKKPDVVTKPANFCVNWGGGMFAKFGFVDVQPS